MPASDVNELVGIGNFDADADGAGGHALPLQSRLGDDIKAMSVPSRIRELLLREELDDDQLARELGVARQHVNQACRRIERCGELVRGLGPDGKIVNRLVREPPAAHSAVESIGVRAGPTPVAGEPLSEEPWFWEGNVQRAVRRHLEATGWRILREANTATQERGIDLLAECDGLRLAVEVKGFPKSTYQLGAKAGQPKPTQPTLQAKHWFSDAFLKLVRLRSEQADFALAIALPNYPRYQTLLGQSRWALDRLGFGVFLVEATGDVIEYMAPGAPLA